MLQWLRNLTGLGTARRSAAGGSRTVIRARYDNAQNTDENQRNWWMADAFSAKSANNFQVRRLLRMRSRYEVANNPYLFGICNSNANDLIDTGPTLKLLTRSARYNRAVERAFAEWADEVGFVEKLRTAKLAKTVDGEGFLILKNVEDLYSSVKLYPVDIEADQVTTPAPANLADLWVDGLTLHPVTGRPVAYHVLRHHPGDFFFPDFNPLRVDQIAARHMIHWFVKFRPGQVRGIPAFTSALDLLSELRAFRRATLQNAQNAAAITAVLESEAPADTTWPASGTGSGSPQPPSTPWDTIPIDRGQMITTPWGAKMKQFDPKQPGTTYKDFHEKCLGEACRPLDYPLTRALGTSKDSNFSSAKLDRIEYRQGLLVERNDCDQTASTPIFRRWFEEAEKIPKLLPDRPEAFTTPPHEWHWPGFPSLDAEADTAADLAAINGGTMTWQEFWAKRGRDWREVMAQQKAEMEEIEKLGLSFGEPLKKQERIDVDDENADASKQGANAAAAPVISRQVLELHGLQLGAGRDPVNLTVQLPDNLVNLTTPITVGPAQVTVQPAQNFVEVKPVINPTPVTIKQPRPPRAPHVQVNAPVTVNIPPDAVKVEVSSKPKKVAIDFPLGDRSATATIREEQP